MAWKSMGIEGKNETPYAIIDKGPIQIWNQITFDFKSLSFIQSWSPRPHVWAQGENGVESQMDNAKVRCPTQKDGIKNLWEKICVNVKKPVHAIF